MEHSDEAKFREDLKEVSGMYWIYLITQMTHLVFGAAFSWIFIKIYAQMRSRTVKHP